jgi:hypothetical protein
MSRLADRTRWAEALRFWGLRGGGCAAPSFGLALWAGFESGSDLGAMGLGVVVYVAGFAALEVVGSPADAADGPGRVWRMVRGAGTVRAGLGVLVLPLVVVPVLGIWAFLDSLPGMLAIEWGQRLVAGTGARGAIGLSLGRFGQVWCITMLQGAFVSAELLVLAGIGGLGGGIRRAFRRWRVREV